MEPGKHSGCAIWGVDLKSMSEVKFLAKSSPEKNSAGERGARGRGEKGREGSFFFQGSFCEDRLANMLLSVVRQNVRIKLELIKQSGVYDYAMTCKKRAAPRKTYSLAQNFPMRFSFYFSFLLLTFYTFSYLLI